MCHVLNSVRIKPWSDLKLPFKLESRIRDSCRFDKSMLKIPFPIILIVDDVVKSSFSFSLIQADLDRLEN